jgi:hypothetical protein
MWHEVFGYQTLMRDNDLQTVFTTTHPTQAEMVRMGLQNEGIAAFIDGANQGGFAGALAVHVSVAQKDVARAAVLVEELDRANLSDEEWDEALGEEVMDEGAT